jgi:hypothetical protein
VGSIPQQHSTRAPDLAAAGVEVAVTQGSLNQLACNPDVLLLKDSTRTMGTRSDLEVPNQAGFTAQSRHVMRCYGSVKIVVSAFINFASDVLSVV